MNASLEAAAVSSGPADAVHYRRRMSTWWERFNTDAHAFAENGTLTSPPELLSDEWLEVMGEVEAAFARTGADTPAWDNPHGRDGMRDPLPEEYSRCLDPQKYRILWARADAWSQVIERRGWAAKLGGTAGEAAGGVITWAVDPWVPLATAIVWGPTASGAASLTLARTAGGDDGEFPGLMIAVGNPAIVIATVPDCGCDACDHGSAPLLEEVDRAILSTIDGSVQVSVSPKAFRMLNSFGSSAHWPAEGCRESAEIQAEPWVPDWTPRTLSGPVG